MGEDLWMGLGLQYSSFLKDVTKVVDTTAKEFERLSNGISKDVEKGTKEASKSINNFSRNAENKLKNVANIIQGILISQGFYRMIGAVKDTVKEVFRLTGALEQANVFFNRVLGEKGARAFLQQIQDFAAETPFQLEESIRAGQRLLAVGFKARQIEPILRSVVDASSALGGDPEIYQNIVRVMSKIQTTGTATARDINSLARAGIPAYKYFQEQLGLTAKELRNIGKLKIPADKAIAVIVKGMQEDFAGMSEEMAKTLPGLLSTIKDDILIIGIEMADGVYSSFKSGAEELVKGLQTAISIVRAQGIGGLFEYLVPPGTQEQVRVVIAALQEFGTTAKLIIGIVNQLAGTAFAQLANVAALVLPPVVALVNEFLSLINVLLENNPLIRQLISGLLALSIVQSVTIMMINFVRVLGALKIVATVTRNIQGLVVAMKALSIAMASNPIIAGGAILIGVLAAIALQSEKVRASIGAVTAQLGSLFGLSTESIFRPEDQEDLSSGLENVESSLEGVTDGFKDADKGAKKAKKSADSFIASFDEVFRIPEKKGKGGGKGDGMNLDDVLFPDGGKGLVKKGTDETVVKETEGLIDRIRNKLKDIEPFILPRFEYPDPPAPPGVNELLQPELEAVQRSFQDSMDQVRDILNKGRDVIVGWGLQVAEAFGSISVPIRGAMEVLPEVEMQFLQMVTNVKTSLDLLQSYLDTQALSFNVWLLGLQEGFGTFFVTLYENTVTQLDILLGAWNTWDISINDLMVNMVTSIIDTVVNFFEVLGASMLDSFNVISQLWENHKTGILTLVGLIIAGIIAWWAELPAAVAAAIASLLPWVTTFFNNVAFAAERETQEGVQAVKGKWEGLKTALSDIWSNIKTTAVTIWEDIRMSIADSIDSIIDTMKELWDWAKKAADKVGDAVSAGAEFFSGSKGAPTVTAGPAPISKLANGGLVKRRQIVEVAEAGDEEAVIPLNTKTLSRLGAAIAEHGGFATSAPTGTQPQEINLNVGVLVADDQGLEELERRLYEIRDNENLRFST